MKLTTAIVIFASTIATASGKRSLRRELELESEESYYSMSMQALDIAAIKGSGSSKSGKESVNNVATLTGYYSGFDTEDGSPQSIALLCDEVEKTCDITLRDSRFSTCEQILGTGSFFGGVGIAKGVPVKSLDDFSIELFCVENKGGTVDFTKQPTTTLTGDIEILPNGQLRRTGPGFFYSSISVFAENGKKTFGDIDDLGYNVNGQFVGIDVSDGSQEVSMTRNFLLTIF